MMRLSIWIFAALVVTACNKPNEADCRKAIANMQHLMGTENLRDAAGIEGEVRRCKGGSKRKAVDCAINATNLDQLQKCDFYHVPANAKGVGTPEPLDSPAGSAGSAGSANVGSGAAGAAMGGAGMAGSDGTGGSAVGSATGSAAGSAAMGSAAAGSAAGSAK